MVDLRHVQPSRYFEDRTGEDKSKIDWLSQLGKRAFENQGIPWEEGTAGLPPELLRELLFRKVMEEFGTQVPHPYSPHPRQFQDSPYMRNPKIPSRGSR